MIRSLCLAVLACASPALAGNALPPAKSTVTAKSGATTASAPAARSCTIGSFTGTLIPGTTICAKVGGFVRAQGNANAGRGTWQP
ncbi:MAG: porin [Alsobacter sp.]